MNSALRYWTARLGSRLSVARPLATRRPIVLIYHGIPKHEAGLNAETFELQIRFLRQHCETVGVNDLHSRRSGFDRIRVLLTFDDGFRNNAEVVAPILRRYQIPAIFFVCSRHAEPNRFLWFSYLRGLERWFRGNGFMFRGEFMDMSPSKRRKTITQLWNSLLQLQPHPQAMYDAIENECPQLADIARGRDIADHCQGMSAEQAGELAADPLFEIGIHTADHPYLTKCTDEESGRQIAHNQQWIETITGKRCPAIAYPLGDYNAAVLRHCEAFNVQYGFSTDRRIPGNPNLQHPRVGIYQPSLEELGFKVCWGKVLIRLQSQGYFTNN